MSWKNISQQVKESFDRVDRSELVQIDPIEVNFNGFDGLIKEKAMNYIGSKYRFAIDSDKKYKNHNDEVMDLVKKAIFDNQDLRVLNKGHTHFTFNCTRVGTNDILRHQSMMFSQYGQSKQINLEIIEDENVNQIKYYLPPEWQKAPILSAEFNSFMTYASHLISELSAEGLPANQIKYIIPNAATCKLEMSGNLRSFYNYVGLRSCEQAQFENQYLSNIVALRIKEVLPELSNWIGPRCVVKNKCPEGDRTCGLFKDKKEIYTGKTRALEELVLEKQKLIDQTIPEKITSKDKQFLTHFENAHSKYVELKRQDKLPEVYPSVTFRTGTDDMEQLIAENAKNTYIRLTGNKTIKDFNFKEGEIEKILNAVVKSEHLGVLDHGSVSLDFKLSRVMLQKFARHTSFGLMASSQHHSEHTNFEYIVPPAWKKKALPEKFHTIMVYLDGLYTRAIDAGVPIHQARYVLPTSASVNLRVSTNPRNWLSYGWQRSCPKNSWEERNLSTKVSEILKSKYTKGLFKYFGPECMMGNCRSLCSDKNTALNVFKDRNQKMIYQYIKE
jgi:thymidylate synthase (FAD)